MKAEKLWSRLLGQVLPTEVKRKLVLVAVFVELEKERGMDHPRLSDLNDQMHLVEDVSILDKLADVAGLLFAPKACPISREAGVVENCSQIMCWMPNWLRYGNDNRIFSDLAEVATSHIKQ